MLPDVIKVKDLKRNLRRAISKRSVSKVEDDGVYNVFFKDDNGMFEIEMQPADGLMEIEWTAASFDYNDEHDVISAQDYAKYAINVKRGVWERL